MQLVGARTVEGRSCRVPLFRLPPVCAGCRPLPGVRARDARAGLCRGDESRHRGALRGRKRGADSCPRRRAGALERRGHRGHGNGVTRVLQYATPGVPVVTTVTNDPVGDGFAASMARPGGNITGFAISAADLNSKLVELLKVIVPKASRVGVLLHPENVAHPPQLRHLILAAQRVGIQVVVGEAGAVPEVEREFIMMTKERVQAAIILPDSFFVQTARTVADQALRHRVPSISINQGFAEAGGFVRYGANLNDNFRRAAIYVDKILKGAKPAEMPFEQPTRYSLVINLKTAKALGLTIPSALLRQAEEVIQ